MNANLLTLLGSFLENNSLFLIQIPLLMLGSFLYGVSLVRIKEKKCFFDERFDYEFSVMLLLINVFGFVLVVLSSCPIP